MGFLIGRCCLYHVDGACEECGSFSLTYSLIRCRGLARDPLHTCWSQKFLAFRSLSPLSSSQCDA